MTIGTVYILLGIIKAFIDIIEKGIVAAGVILLLLSFAYGIHDIIRGRCVEHGRERFKNTDTKSRE